MSKVTIKNISSGTVALFAPEIHIQRELLPKQQFNLEKEAIDLKELYTTKEEAAKIRAMVEKFLGRPIRPREELEKDFTDTHHVEFTDTYDL